jgi:hypothetical protein
VYDGWYAVEMYCAINKIHIKEGRKIMATKKKKKVKRKTATKRKTTVKPKKVKRTLRGTKARPEQTAGH